MDEADIRDLLTKRDAAWNARDATAWFAFFASVGAEGSVIVGKLLDNGKITQGFDAQSGTYVDMLKAGIIDPTKVVRLALQGAASVAGLLITTEAMIADKPQRGSALMPGGGMDDSGF